MYSPQSGVDFAVSSAKLRVCLKTLQLMFWKRPPAATVEAVTEVEAAARLPPPPRTMPSLFEMLGVNTKCGAKENALAYQSPILSVHDSS